MTLTEGEVLAQHGIDSAVSSADLRWLHVARLGLDAYIREGQPFTSEDVLLFCEEAGHRTAEPRALGGVIREAVRDGRIRATGDYRKSTRPQSHARPQAVWVKA